MLGEHNSPQSQQPTPVQVQQHPVAQPPAQNQPAAQSPEQSTAIPANGVNQTQEPEKDHPEGEQPQQPQLPASVAQVHQAAAQAISLQQQAPTGLNQNVPNRSTTTNVYRPLNVKDALSYLDQVKIQFYNQADVYNNFLDIMKDFKSQSIDTPGVIDRVSTLFKGHPNLIQGFNTFLPPGYRIECSLDPSDPNPIRVTTPTGTTTTRPGNYSGEWQNDQAGYDQQLQSQALPPHQQAQQQLVQVQQAGQGDDSQDGNSDQMNHAITYVNKIKTRFANQPDIYKQFLEILQTYQREQKPIGEVYERVTELFSNSPDLLDDFKQFLPDTSAAQNDEYNNTQLPPVGNFQQPPPGNNGMNANGSQYNQQLTYQHQLPAPPFASQPPQLPHSQFGQAVQPQVAQGPFGQPQPQQGLPSQHAQNYSIVGGLPGNPEASGMINNGNGELARKKKSVSEANNYETNYNNEAQYSSLRSDIQPRIKPGSQVTTKNGITTVTNPTLVPGIPEPVPSSTFNKTSSLLDEISFFDKVKKAIGNKQTYNDFLKILNLYSQDIIDKDTLIDKVESFIGDLNPDLLNWFKMFVGYEEKTQSIESILFKKHQLELSLCKAYGPSYRQLPKAETYMPCSGRDEMCWEVLNDEWVGHPTWASEDSGFVAHRKNQYEEILFKIEEERLEYDYHMEANLRTIQTLETIANRIANMTPEQKATFKLPPGLGHTSMTIYKKVIRKVYDKDRGFEVIDALHENPAIAVPVVLKRLKQKDEEWRKAQREWNKVWREMEQKVFYKSLDHLGLTFKQADKKLLTAKQLISEISTVKVEQQNKRLYPLTPKPQEQLNYKFDDFEILYDILKLSDVFINKSSNYSSNDREKLTQFFQYFISLFFGIPNEEITGKVATRKATEVKALEQSTNEKEATPVSETEAESEKEEGANGSSPSKKRPRDHDLLKDVLKKQSKSRKEEPESSVQSTSESEDQESVDEVEKSSELWISTTGKSFSLKDNETSLEKRDIFNLFGNTTIYVFFRHLRTLYERLEEVKLMNDEISKDIKTRKYSQFAKDLNLVNHQLEDMNVEILGDRDCYKQVLALSERLIEGELEHQWFEEAVRQGYKNKAYKVYTIDKVVQAMIKHMHTMVTDSKTSEMMVLFETDRKTPVSTAKDQILYRMQIRSLMTNEENMFKIVFKEADNSVNIQFVSLDDLTINDHKTAEEHYNYYVTSYIMSHPTEGVSASKINMPFSKSFIENIEEDQCEGYVNPGLKVSICENSYRLFFESGSHDEYTANTVFENPVEDSKSTDDKLATLTKHLNDEEIGWKLTLFEAQTANSHLYEEKLDKLFSNGITEYNETVVDIKEDDENTESKETGSEEKEQDQEPLAADPVGANGDGDVEMKDADAQDQKESDDAAKKEQASKPHPDATIDADTTMMQDHNDTTADDNTINDSAMGENTATEPTSAGTGNDEKS